VRYGTIFVSTLFLPPKLIPKPLNFTAISPFPTVAFGSSLSASQSHRAPGKKQP